MSVASIFAEFNPRFDADQSWLEFIFTGERNEMILASSPYAPEAQVRAWVTDIDQGRCLRLTLSPHTYFGPDDEDDSLDDLILSGVVIASFSDGEAEYVVPPNVFVDYACRLLSRYSVTEYRVFWMLNQLSPRTADLFAEQLVSMDLPDGAGGSRGLRRVEPTIQTRANQPLLASQVIWLFEDTKRVMSLRQLEEFLPMKMQNLKPHLYEAGILPKKETHTRNVAVTTRRLLDTLIPYMVKHPNQQFIAFLGILRDHEIIPDYEKPPRP